MQDANTIDLIERFNKRHGLNLDGQLKMLASELGELHEALLTGDGVAEELADCLFVTISADLLSETKFVEYKKFGRDLDSDTHAFELLADVCDLNRITDRPVRLRPTIGTIKARLYAIAENEGVDLERELRQVTLENMDKSESKSGDKVTKE